MIDAAETSRVARTLQVIAENMQPPYVHDALRYARTLSPTLEYDAERWSPTEGRLLVLAAEVERLNALLKSNASDYARAGTRAR